MTRSGLAIALIAALSLAATGRAPAADDSKVKAATKQVESGAKKVGQGEIGPGVAETAKGIGNTVVEGARFTGEKLKESGQAAEPPARTAWQRVKAGAHHFGQSVRNFFSTLFSG